MKHPNKTRVSYNPRTSEDQTYAGHKGTVIYFTTDGFHRVEWDNPNPNPDFFNLGTVFLPNRLTPIE